MRKQLFIALLFFGLFVSCNNSNKGDYLPPSNGKINSMAIVIDNELWNGSVGDAVRAKFAAPMDGLPQDEPLFFIHQIPPGVFKGNTRNSRNILMILEKKDRPNSYSIKDTLFAKPQKVAVINGQTQQEIISEIDKESSEIIKAFKENEVHEAQTRFQRSLNKEKTLADKFDIELTMPSVYKVVSEKDNFLWIERPIKGGNANLFIYTIPFNRIPKGDDRVEAIIKVRDSIGKLHVPGRVVEGRDEPTYMITQDAFAPSVYDTMVSDRKTVESRGLWAIDGVALGGPFVNYMIEDKPNNRLVVIDGVVLANMMPKRDYIFELEAIVRSIKFVK